jgi:hypothetical protein
MRFTPFVLFILFSLLVSAGLGMLGKGTARQRVRSAVSTFVLFIVVGLAIAWLIYPFSH